jgi:HEAT repeat protein
MKNIFLTLVLACGVAFAQEDQLLSVLKSDASRKEKVDACRDLARFGSPKAVPVLAPLLLDPDLSDMARYALEPIANSAVDAALRDALGKAKGPMAVGIVSSLANRKDSKAAEPIAKLLADPDPLVAQAAARALGSIGGSSAVKALEGALNGGPNQPAVIEGLLRAAEKASGSRATAIYDRLRSLPDQPLQVRVAALRGAILSRGAKGVPLLVEALHTEAYVPAANAVKISTEMRGTAVTKALAAELATANPDKQLLLVQALGWRRDATAIAALTPLAQTGSGEVRIAAIRSLVQLRDASILPLLVALLQEADPAIATEAQTGLIGLPGKDAGTALLTLLNQSNPKVRTMAIEGVTLRRVSAAIPALLKLTGDSDPDVVKASFGALAVLGGVGEIPAIMGAMRKPDSLGLAEAALSRICSSQPDPTVCADPLLSGLKSLNGEPKLAVVRVLCIAGGPRALVAVRGMTRETDPAVRETALRVLCDWPTADALPDLEQIAKGSTDTKMKVLAVRGQLRLIGLESVPDAQKLAQLKELLPLIERKDEQRLALAALGPIANPEALSLVRPFLSDASLKEEAGIAAVSIAEKIVVTHPAEVAEALKQVQVSDKKVAARAKAVLARVPPGTVKPGSTAIFNGKDLTGWTGAPGWWTVQAGALTSESTPEKPCKAPNYLVWRGGQPADFELLADFKLSRAANSGIQIRSEERPNFDTFGYQADMTGDGKLIGFVYHHQRGLIGGRGEKVVIAADGKKTTDKLCDPDEALKHFKMDDWNTYRVVCHGPEIAIYLNGVLVSQITDHQAKQPAGGIIALQMHPGPPMKVQFKNIMLKELK